MAKIGPSEIWILTFVPAVGFGAPMAVRVRRLLKAALRSFGCRCIHFTGPVEIEYQEPAQVQALARAQELTEF